MKFLYNFHFESSKLNLYELYNYKNIIYYIISMYGKLTITTKNFRKLFSLILSKFYKTILSIIYLEILSNNVYQILNILTFCQG